MKQLTDEQLAEGCLRGENGCEHELFKRWYGKLGGICRRFANSDDEVKDLLQESFIKIFEKLEMFRGESSLATWMKRVTMNHCINYYKKALRKEFESQIDDNMMEEIPDEEYIFMESISAEKVLDCIRKLPQGYRVVLTLYAVENKTHNEIAELLGITTGTSKSQLNKARKTLRKLIEPYSLQIPQQKEKIYHGK
ncbi:MAG: sigma-70 family RNA polymerase sigma factor [Bacteroidota bacterium]|nr:sigma-70 family RNA polymerase sigma factor [Bacteroidota bacterium]